MSKNVNYSKHQKSRFKRFVATMPDGTQLEADTEGEIKEAIEVYHLTLSKPEKVKVESQKFDPNTGEPL